MQQVQLNEGVAAEESILLALPRDQFVCCDYALKWMNI